MAYKKKKKLLLRPAVLWHPLLPGVHSVYCTCRACAAEAAAWLAADATDGIPADA